MYRSINGIRCSLSATSWRQMSTSKSKTPQAIVPKDDKTDDSKAIVPDVGYDKGLLYPESMDLLEGRLVRISKPSKNVMQSGTAYTNTWKIEYNSQNRWEDLLMGWTSTDDPLSNLSLNFPTKQDAIAYCEKNKLNWFVEEQPERKVRRKSYADNFSWDKRTRLGSK